MFKGAHERVKWPLGWPANGYPEPQGKFYCSNGHERMFSRDIMEAHTAACLYSGLSFSGTNAEVMPGQAEYQIGPADLITGADHMHIARFLLTRICEERNIFVDFNPKPIDHGDWNGAGCHINYSTKDMRAEGGMGAILKAIEKLSTVHKEHIEVYG